MFRFLAAALVAAPALAQPATYPTAQGGEIVLPGGTASFADAVVAFDEGDPPSKIAESRVPENLLGEPDHAERDRAGFLTLGCEGSVTLAFEDNALIDVEGADLHVFEVGQDVEPMTAAISTDGAE